MLGVARMEINTPDRDMNPSTFLSEIEKNLVAENAFGNMVIVSNIRDVGFRMRRSDPALPHTGGDISFLDELCIFIEESRPNQIIVEIVWKEYFYKLVMGGILIAIAIMASWPPGIGLISFIIFGVALFVGILVLQIKKLQHRVLSAISDIEVSRFASTKP